MPKFTNRIVGTIRGHVQGDNVTINITGGRVEVPCEVEGCKRRAIHTVKGYHFCTPHAQAFAGYTPEIDPNLID